MFRKVLPVFAVALVALGLAATAYARIHTTGPDHVDNVAIKLRDSGLSTSKGTFLREDTARFIVSNLGTKPYRFKLGRVSTPLLRPGKTKVVLVQLTLRGTFPLLQLNAAGKRVSAVPIKIT